MLKSLRCILRNNKVLSNFNTKYSTKEGIIVSSPCPDVEIPNITLHQYMLRNLHKWDDKVAVECAETKRKLTYNQVYKKSKNVAGFIQKYGLTKGDTIGIVLPNVPEYFIVLLGAMQSGVTISTINPIYTSDEIKRQLISAKAKLVFTLVSFYPTVKKAVDEIQDKIEIVTIKHKDEANPTGCILFEDIYSKSYDFREPIISPDDVLLLPFSSGTTGLPKGVQLTHKNLVANSCQSSAPGFKMNLDTDKNVQDVTPLICPMFHLYGLGCVSFTMFSEGLKIITAPTFNIESLYNLLHNYNSTLFYAVPPLIIIMLNNPALKLEKVKTLRTVLSAAAPLGAADINRFYSKTNGKVNLVQLYGMTETSPITLHQSLVLDKGVKPGSSGLVVPNTQAKIVEVNDPDFKGVGPNIDGELLVRGPQVMKGYSNNEKANSEIFVGDGWLRSGDIVHYDEDGQFYVTDRLKELIKVKGFQVAPAELEELLRDHPDIKDVAVIGVPHKESGEAPKAFVVTKDGSKIKAEDIHKYMKDKVVKYKQLTGGIEFTDMIPKTASGKILRRHLRDQ